MTHHRSLVLQSIRWLALSLSLMFSTAQADEHSDVSQLIRSGKLADALAKAEQFLAVKPQDLQMRFFKGVIQRDSGRISEAIETFTRLTEDYPEQPEPYNNVAVLYASQNRFDKALVALEMAIRTNPSYATAHENLGDVYAKLASQAYTKSLQLDGSNQALAPKLTRLRELFGPSGAKAQKPAAPTVNGAPASVVTKAAPASPKPVVAKATAGADAAPATQSPAATADSGAAKEVELAVQAWASAWAAKDVKSYLANYAADFAPATRQSRSDWEQERQQRISSKSSISVTLANLSVTVSANKAYARFRQDYKADKLQASDRKTLELVKKGDQWQIVKESVGN